MQKNNKKVYVFLMILVCIFWGAGNPVTKLGLETIPPFLMLAFRFGGAFVVFFAIFRMKIIRTFNKRNILPCILLSLVTAFTYITSQLAIMLTTATMAGFLMGLSVLFTPVLNFLIYKKNIDKKFIPVIIIVVIGMYFLCGGGFNFQFGLGELFALICSLFYGLWLVLTPKYVRDVGPVALSSIQCGIATIVCIPLFFILEYPFDITTISTESWLALIYVSLICTFVVYLIQNQSLKYLSAVFVSIVLCFEPVCSAIVSYLLLGEMLSLPSYIGGMLIIGGLILASILEEKAEPEKL